MLDLHILNYVIKSNSRNVILTKTKKDKKMDAVVGYYQTIPAALNALTENHILSKNSKELTSVDDLRAELNIVLEEFKNKKDDILAFMQEEKPNDDDSDTDDLDIEEDED